MIGNITRRGKNSWRLKYEAGERDPVTGKRRTRFVTVRGTKKAAQAELVRLLGEVNSGTAVDPSKATIAEYVNAWLDTDAQLSPKTKERYLQLAAQQIVPHLGSTLLQRLRPSQVSEWHGILLHSGGKNGRPLSARTVGHAHRILHRAYERAFRLELVTRNPVHAVTPPKPDAPEVEILSSEQIAMVLSALAEHPLHPIVSLALGTGLRRGELCALTWATLDLDANTVRVERSLEETAAGLRFKAPKTRHGRRTIAIPPPVAEVMRDHRRWQFEQRLSLGLGRPSPDDLVFTLPDGMPWPPDKVSRDWSNTVRSRCLPRVMFHALRHSHA
jgi:integrase